MSAVLPNNKPRLTTSYSFSKVPAVERWNTPAITPALHSNGAESVRSLSTTSRARNIDREEPCFITKSLSFTHERAHWVNAVRNDPIVKEQVEKLLDARRIVHGFFKLDDVTNLTNMDRSLHAALDKYAFFAVTGALETLNNLTQLLEANNKFRQEWYDHSARDPGRNINFTQPPVSDARYELVVLRPDHFLPDQSVLTVYDRAAGGQVLTKTYTIGLDHTLRRPPGHDANTCERFPPFAFDYSRSRGFPPPNPFLVILNAEIKFRRYLREFPTPTVLPADVMELICKTIRLVELIYWDPAARPGTLAWVIEKAMNVDDTAKLPQLSAMDMGEMGTRGNDEDGDRTLRPRNVPNVGRRQPGLSATLEERRDYGQYLLSGRDLPDSEDEFSSEELQSDLDDHEALSTARLDKIHIWKRTVEVQ